MSSANPSRLTGGPCKIRLIDQHGVGCVRICEAGQVESELARYIAEGYTLDLKRCRVGRGWTENPSRL